MPGNVGTVATDPITPNRLYAVTTGPTRLVRFSTADAVAPEDGPQVDVTHVAVGVRGDAVAWAWLGSTSPVWYGSFTGSLSQGPDVSGGATFLRWLGSSLYWAESASSGCLFRDAASPVAFGCSPGQFVDSAAFDATSMVTLSPGADPWVERVQLPGGGRALEDISGPAVAGDPGSPSIALDGAGHAFYFTVSPAGQVRRFVLGGTWANGDDELVADVGGAFPVAVFVSGSQVFWATRNFSTGIVRVQRAEAGAQLPAAITTLSSFAVPSGDQLRSWAIDATGVYFVREVGGAGTIYRVAR